MKETILLNLVAWENVLLLAFAIILGIYLYFIIRAFMHSNKAADLEDWDYSIGTIGPQEEGPKTVQLKVVEELKTGKRKPEPEARSKNQDPSETVPPVGTARILSCGTRASHISKSGKLLHSKVVKIYSDTVLLRRGADHFTRTVVQ